MSRTNILIVDDHAIVRKGLQMFFEADPSIRIIGEAENGLDAVSQAESLHPEVILMDLVLPEASGVEAIAEIKRRVPDVKIIVLTTFGDETRVREAMEAGADGYLLKDADGDVLRQAILAVRQGEMPLHPHVAQHLFRSVTKRQQANADNSLTEREKEVLRLVARGLSNQAAAELLTLSENTIKAHLRNILRKLSVSTRTEAVVWAIQMGLIAPHRDN